MLAVEMMSQLLKRLDAALHSLTADRKDLVRNKWYIYLHDSTNSQHFEIHVKFSNTYAFSFLYFSSHVLSLLLSLFFTEYCLLIGIYRFTFRYTKLLFVLNERDIMLLDCLVVTILATLLLIFLSIGKGKVLLVDTKYNSILNL